MKTIYVSIAIMLIVLCGLVCELAYDPLDLDNPDYIKTKISLLIDTTGIDTFFTETKIRVGVRCSLMERVKSVDFNFGLGIHFTKANTTQGQFKELWLDTTYRFETPGTYTIKAYAFTINHQDPEDSVQITVFGKKPYITKQPVAPVNTVVEDSSMSFSVTAGGTPTLEYQWYKDSTNDSGILIAGAALSKFTIPAVILADSGNYFCIVKNAFGSIKSNEVKLTVVPQTPDSTWPSVFFKDSTQSGLENANGIVNLYLSKTTLKNVTARLKIASSSTAQQGIDFTFADSTITFSAGQTVKTLNIKVYDDMIKEPNETVILQIASIQNAVLSTSGILKCTYTIIDNDIAAAGFTTGSQGITETDTGFVKDSIPVILSNKSSTVGTVDYRVIPEGTTATGGGGDFLLTGSGTLTFPAMKDTAFIHLNIYGDTLVEPDETIRLALGNPQDGLSINAADSVLTYTIRDNDTVPVAFNAGQNDTVPETDSLKILTVALGKVCGDTVTCGYKVNGGTATDGTDFVLQGSGTLKFVPGIVQQQIKISIIDDQTPEPDETATIELFDPSSNAKLGSLKTFTITIIDNEKPTVSFKQAQGSSYESIETVNIPVTLSYKPFKAVTIPFTVSTQSTAQNGTDFTISASPITFSVGESVEKNIVLSVVNDKIVEPDETVIINLGTPVNAIIGQPAIFTDTIVNDDYTISPVKIGNGAIVPGKDTIVSRGDSLSLLATPAKNWNFNGWTVSQGLNLINASSSNAVIRNIDTSGTVTGSFKIDTFTITVSSGANGNVSSCQ